MPDQSPTQQLHVPPSLSQRSSRWEFNLVPLFKTYPNPRAWHTALHTLHIWLVGWERWTACSSSACKAKECAHKSTTVLQGKEGRISVPIIFGALFRAAHPAQWGCDAMGSGSVTGLMCLKHTSISIPALPGGIQWDWALQLWLSRSWHHRALMDLLPF